eukprot:UN30717
MGRQNSNSSSNANSPRTLFKSIERGPNNGWLAVCYTKDWKYFSLTSYPDVKTAGKVANYFSKHFKPNEPMPNPTLNIQTPSKYVRSSWFMGKGFERVGGPVFFIPAGKVSAFIGHGGQGIKELRKKFPLVHIQVHPFGSDVISDGYNIISISSTVTISRDKVMEAVLDKLRNECKMELESLYLLIPLTAKINNEKEKR